MRKAGTRDRSGVCVCGGGCQRCQKGISQPENDFTDSGFDEVRTSEIIWEALSSLG